MSVNIRQARKADLSAVLRLYAQPEIDDGVVLSAEAAEAIFDRFSRYPDYRLFVAEHQGEIVGSYALLVMDNLGHLGARSAVIEDVVVDPDYQGSGIGRAMMSHAISEARIKGCYKATLSANMKRERAHAFYESIGFERHGYSFLLRLEETV